MDPEKLKRRYRGRPIGPDTRPGLLHFVALAADNGADLLVVLSPWPGSAPRAQTDARAAKIQALLRELRAQHPQLTLYAPFVRYYPDELCCDDCHLKDVGAERNTRELAEWYLATYGEAGSAVPRGPSPGQATVERSAGSSAGAAGRIEP